MKQTPDVLILGAGIGGTALGALLASQGRKVRILERNAFVGGRCVSYRKEGFTIDVFVHMFGRCEKGPYGEILRRAGRPDALRWHRDPGARDRQQPGHPGNHAEVRGPGTPPPGLRGTRPGALHGQARGGDAHGDDLPRARNSGRLPRPPLTSRAGVSMLCTDTLLPLLQGTGG